MQPSDHPSVKLTATNAERARRYLQKVPPAVSGAGGHDATFRAAAVLVHGFALDPVDALPLILEWNGHCQPPWSEGELVHKLNSALAAGHRHPRGYLLGEHFTGHRAPLPRSHPAPRRRVEFDPAALARIAAKTARIDRAWLAARSPLRPDNRTPASFLHSLYEQGENVLIFTDKVSQGEIWTHPGLPFDASTLDPVREGHLQGVLFLDQPVDGEWRDVERLKTDRNPRGCTRRAEENVTAWRYAVIESDITEPLQWLRALVQMPLPIASIVTSGGRSMHALVRVDATSKAEWDQLVREGLSLPLVALGADLGALTAVRLTRLPCCWRGDTGAYQELLYLNPTPDTTPICELPACEIGANHPAIA